MGWGGAAGVIIAYGLVSSARVDGNSKIYQSLNLVGSLFLIANTFYYGAVPSAFINMVWAGIAIYSLSKKNRI